MILTRNTGRELPSYTATTAVANIATVNTRINGT